MAVLTLGLEASHPGTPQQPGQRRCEGRSPLNSPHLQTGTPPPFSSIPRSLCPAVCGPASGESALLSPWSPAIPSPETQKMGGSSFLMWQVGGSDIVLAPQRTRVKIRPRLVLSFQCGIFGPPGGL